MTARVNNPQALDGIATLDLPPEITLSAPPVHIAADNEVVWRLVASREGAYDVKIKTGAGGDSCNKTVRVTSQLAELSPDVGAIISGSDFSSGESALPDNSAVESISVDYPERNIPLGVAGYEMNWIWLFFILSMVAGFIFKELLGIEV